MSWNFPPTKFSTHCVALSIHGQIWTGDVCFFSLLAPYWQYSWYTGSPFSSCPVCDGWGSEQSSVESRSTTNRKQGQYLKQKSLKYLHDSLASQQTNQHNCHTRVGTVALWPPKCLCKRASLLHSLTSQTQPIPWQIAFSKPDLTNPSADGF